MLRQVVAVLTTSLVPLAAHADPWTVLTEALDGRCDLTVSHVPSGTADVDATISALVETGKLAQVHYQSSYAEMEPHLERMVQASPAATWQPDFSTKLEAAWTATGEGNEPVFAVGLALEKLLAAQNAKLTYIETSTDYETFAIFPATCFPAWNRVRLSEWVNMSALSFSPGFSGSLDPADWPLGTRTHGGD